eukprot:6174092-Pleurochrysis_carterae.AAC.1
MLLRRRSVLTGCGRSDTTWASGSSGTDGPAVLSTRVVLLLGPVCNPGTLAAYVAGRSVRAPVRLARLALCTGVGGHPGFEELASPSATATQSQLAARSFAWDSATRRRLRGDLVGEPPAVVRGSMPAPPEVEGVFASELLMAFCPRSLPLCPVCILLSVPTTSALARERKPPALHSEAVECTTPRESADACAERAAVPNSSVAVGGATRECAPRGSREVAPSVADSSVAVGGAMRERAPTDDSTATGGCTRERVPAAAIEDIPGFECLRVIVPRLAASSAAEGREHVARRGRFAEFAPIFNEARRLRRGAQLHITAIRGGSSCHPLPRTLASQRGLLSRQRADGTCPPRQTQHRVVS